MKCSRAELATGIMPLINLIAIGFDAATKRHVEIVDGLPPLGAEAGHCRPRAGCRIR